MEPWPNWNPEKTENSNRVVPDVFLRFDNFDVIIEAKRWDSRQQNPHQWKKEFTAYLNEYGSENVSAIMIAIGGVWETADEEVVVSNIRCPVYMCKWERILSECQRMEKELHRRKYNSSQSLAHRRILLDVIDLFSWHGYQTGVWYEDIASKFRLEPSFDSHFHVFRNISAQLSRS